MAATENWGRDTLRAKIDGMLFERTAIATKPEELIKKELANLRESETLSPDLVLLRQLHKSLEAAKENLPITQSGK